MTPGWVILAIGLLGAACAFSPLAAALGALAATILLLDRANHTIAPILRLAISAARAFTYGHDDCVARIQDLCIFIIRWRKI